MLRFARLLINALAFFHIILGMTIAGVFAGLLINSLVLHATNMTPFYLSGGLGLIIGLVWAIRVARKQDPADYISRVRSTDTEPRDIQ
jgi:hypothetical protein